MGEADGSLDENSGGSNEEKIEGRNGRVEKSIRPYARKINDGVDVRKLIEKYEEKRRRSATVFMDLEKVHDDRVSVNGDML